MATALFLDRDGVINIEKDGSYIFNRDEFEFYDGARQALATASLKFDYTFVVTNQRGVGRGYMTEEDLKDIHAFLAEEVRDAGGRIHRIYYATSVESDHPMRKPNTGMAARALEDFPDIDFSKSVMIGNNLSDMQFGKSMGMKTVFLHTTSEPVHLPHNLIDEQFPSLERWASTLDKNMFHDIS